MRSYAIGDIHGHIGKLIAAHDLIAADRRRSGDIAAPVVHVGDLVDRGPDSRGVIDHLRAGLARGAPWVVLKGNHDRLFTSFMADPERPDPGLRPGLGWLHPALGGRHTLASYGVTSAHEGRPREVQAEAATRVPRAHLDFLAGLPTWYRRGEAVFVHAGIRPGTAVEAQAEDDLVWIREPFLTFTDDHGALVVHGHTVVDAATHYGNRLNIDSGAAFGGPLSAVVVEGRAAWLLTDGGRVPLLPPA